LPQAAECNGSAAERALAFTLPISDFLPHPITPPCPLPGPAVGVTRTNGKLRHPIPAAGCRLLCSRPLHKLSDMNSLSSVIGAMLLVCAPNLGRNQGNGRVVSQGEYWYLADENAKEPKTGRMDSWIMYVM